MVMDALMNGAFVAVRRPHTNLRGACMGYKRMCTCYVRTYLMVNLCRLNGTQLDVGCTALSENGRQVVFRTLYFFICT